MLTHRPKAVDPCGVCLSAIYEAFIRLLLVKMLTNQLSLTSRTRAHYNSRDSEKDCKHYQSDKTIQINFAWRGRPLVGTEYGRGGPWTATPASH